MNATATRSSREALMDDFDTVVNETEQLLKSAGNVGEEQGAAIRAKIEQRIAEATERLAQLREDATERAYAAAKATDRFVQEDPWRAVSIGAGVAALAGFVLGAWIARR